MSFWTRTARIAVGMVFLMLLMVFLMLPFVMVFELFFFVLL